MEIWLASGNTHKQREFKLLLRDLEPDLHGQGELSYYSSPDETGETFEANARIKAKALAAVQPGVWVIADDSGLCCEGLNGLPGIHSARYAGPTARDTENVSKLLKMLQMRSQNRSAYFISVVCAISPEGQEHVFEGRLNGEIARKQSGTSGFGYDAVFIADGYEKTLAELDASEKNKISHRAVATKALRDFLVSL